jgi:hypothetical protein
LVSRDEGISLDWLEDFANCTPVKGKSYEFGTLRDHMQQAYKYLFKLLLTKKATNSLKKGLSHTDLWRRGASSTDLWRRGPSPY